MRPKMKISMVRMIGIVAKKLKPTAPQERFEEPRERFFDPIRIKNTSGIVTSGITNTEFKIPTQVQLLPIIVMIKEKSQMIDKITRICFFMKEEIFGTFCLLNLCIAKNRPGIKSRLISSEAQAITKMVLDC
jgi:hypothetical protein